MLPDMDALLAPIDAASPCGEDLAFSEDFDRIQEARRADDDSLDAGEWARDLKRADWPGVVDLAGRLLTTRSKDLRLAVWLGEALAKIRGFAGLAQGFDLVRALMENHWQDLHPRMEQDDVQERSGNLAWFVTRSAELLREIPLLHSEQGTYAWNDFETARALQMRMDRDPDHADTLSAGQVTMSQLQAAQAATSRAYFTELQRDFALLSEAARALETVIDARLGEEGPSYSPLRSAIEAVQSVVERFTQQAGVSAKPASVVAEPAHSVSAPTDAGHLAGPIQTRQQALQQLRLVAEFFRRTEPHSPVTYLAEKAARWGELPLHAWLRQVIHDGSVLAQLEELLGTDTPEAKG